ncbi:hypothetical protein Glove_19g42 [Diversispora epigaea]|uniref:Uncharacterized protein n=1 Tax=Diversispora epigaea TaxID=1348612 RepID=A0A397JKS8_9GLOM|nr:hypothetical protein Glove_19g42 [Diversispora epigaea]
MKNNNNTANAVSTVDRGVRGSKGDIDSRGNRDGGSEHNLNNKFIEKNPIIEKFSLSSSENENEDNEKEKISFQLFNEIND